jgi:predicted O-methyltransferase YrrM
MSKYTTLDDRLYAYLLAHQPPEHDQLRALRARTSVLPDARMQITPEQGHFLGLLVRLIAARHVLEIGTFTGYSALAMALALPPGGRLTACDVSTEWTSIGREYWKQAGVADKIDRTNDGGKRRRCGHRAVGPQHARQRPGPGAHAGPIPRPARSSRVPTQLDSPLAGLTFHH